MIQLKDIVWCDMFSLPEAWFVIAKAIYVKEPEVIDRAEHSIRLAVINKRVSPGLKEWIREDLNRRALVIKVVEQDFEYTDHSPAILTALLGLADLPPRKVPLRQKKR